jgi:hypothetical protein
VIVGRPRHCTNTCCHVHDKAVDLLGREDAGIIGFHKHHVADCYMTTRRTDNHNHVYHKAQIFDDSPHFLASRPLWALLPKQSPPSVVSPISVGIIPASDSLGQLLCESG